MRKIYFYSFIASLLLLHTAATAQEIDPNHAAQLLYQAYQTSQGHPNHTDKNCYAYEQNEFYVPCMCILIIFTLPEDQSKALTKLVTEINAEGQMNLEAAQGIIDDGLVKVTFHKLAQEYRITSSSEDHIITIKFRRISFF